MTGVVRTKQLPQRIAIIDSDMSQAHEVQKHLRALGTPFLQVYQNPDDGIQGITLGNFTCAIIEWKLAQGTSGFALLSRIRRIPELVNFPVIITVSSMKQTDFLTLLDFQATRVIERPIKTRNLSGALSSLHLECEWYKTNQREIANIIRLSQLNGAHALTALRRITTNSHSPTPLMMLVARQLITSGFYTVASELFEDVLRIEPGHIAAINGKALLLTRMGLHREALETLHSVQDLSHENLEKISEIGNQKVSLREPEKSISMYRTALQHKTLPVKSVQMDGKHHAGEALDLNLARHLSIAAEPAIARMMNNAGVSLALDGELERALKYYFVSFAYLNDRDLQSKVSFNIGLGFKRWKKFPQAKYWLDVSLRLADGDSQKAERHLAGLKHLKGKPGLDDVLTTKKAAPAHTLLNTKVNVLTPQAKAAAAAPKLTQTLPRQNPTPAAPVSNNETKDKWSKLFEEIDELDQSAEYEFDQFL